MLPNEFIKSRRQIDSQEKQIDALAGSTLGPPFYAITKSNWSAESAEARPLFKAPCEDGLLFRAELDCG